MANLRITDHLRLQLEAANSPTTFTGMQPGLGLSPVTDLAFNLSGTSLGSTPRRRLSLSSVDSTPTPTKTKIKLSELSEADSSSTEHRLFKNKIKLSNSNGGNSSRSRGFPHRINVNLPTSPQNYDKSSSAQNDKENMGCGGGSLTGVVSETDVTPFTQHNSPTKQISANSSKYSVLKQITSPLRQRQPLEDQDPNSQDSGYGAFIDKEDAKSGFCFAEPNGLPPRKFQIEQSPRKENSPPKCSWNKASGHSNASLFHSLSSGSESIDDGFTDLLDLEKVEESENLPSGISSLLSGTIIRGHSAVLSENNSPKEERPKPLLQRSLSLVDNHTPGSSRVRSCLFKPSSSSNACIQDDNSDLVGLDPLRSFKRPEPPCELGPLQPKRRKSSSLHSIRENALAAPSLQRSFSETEATIKRALLRSTQNPDLIGDFSKPFILPLMKGRHQDLKTISADTLASLMNGDYSEEVESYTVVDCRYPYEYEGGHIKGAKNVYTKEQILKEFVDKPPESSANTDAAQEKDSNGTKRNILIFHCEFSSERGPSLFRFLRNSDRDQNKESYPSLNYPELYLLHGGYKTFFERHSDKCEPCAYRPMLDPNHETDLRLFRSKSKSWNGDNKSRLALRSNLKRLGL